MLAFLAGSIVLTVMALPLVTSAFKCLFYDRFTFNKRVIKCVKAARNQNKLNLEGEGGVP